MAVHDDEILRLYQAGHLSPEAGLRVEFGFRIQGWGLVSRVQGVGV